MNYISPNEAAEKWHISSQRVRTLCREDRIAGCVRMGRNFLIPSDAPKPEDPRKQLKTQHQEVQFEEREELKEGLDLLKQCFEGTKEIFYIMDPDTYEVVYANRMVHERVGRPIEGTACYASLCDRTEPCEQCPRQKTDNRIFYYAKADKYYSLYSRQVVLGGKGYVAISGTDITGEMRAREMADKERKQYELLYEEIPAGLLVYQRQGEDIYLIRANQYLYDICGIPGRRLLDEKFNKELSYIYPDDTQQVLEAIEKAFATDETVQSEFRLWNPNKKTYLWVRGIAKKGQKTKTNSQCIFVNLQDITKDYELSEKLKEHRIQLETAETHSNVHYFDYDVKSRIGIVGKQAQRAYALDSNIMLDFPKPLFRPDILFPKDYAVYETQFDMILSGKEKEIVFYVRVWSRMKESYLWRKVQLVAQFDANGILSRIAGTSLDIDEYIRLEQNCMQALAQNGVTAWDYDYRLHRGRVYQGIDQAKTYSYDGMFDYERVHPDYVKRLKDYEQALKNGIKVGALDMPVYHRERQTYIWTRLLVQPIIEPGILETKKFLCTIREIQNG